MFLILFLNKFKVFDCLTHVSLLDYIFILSDYNIEPKWLALFSKSNIVEPCASAQQQLASTEVFVTGNFRLWLVIVKLWL